MKREPPKRSSQRIKLTIFKTDANDEWDSDDEKSTEKNKNKNNIPSTRSRQKQTQKEHESQMRNTLQIKLKIPSQPQAKKKKTEKEMEIKLPKDMDPEPVCPMCLKIIIGDFDECIGPLSSTTSSTITPIASGNCTPYTETRASMSIVNVDEDDFGYGKSQYSEEDITKVISNSKKKKNNLNNSEAEKQEIRNSMLVQGILSTSAPNSDFVSLQLAIKSLLDRLATAPKCAVCWETLKMPSVTSVNCWHVCCESCWLMTLGTKRLCPHCSTITNPSDLRKVFF